MLLKMNPDANLLIGQLDEHISTLRATLSDLRQTLMNNENDRFAFAQLHQKRNLEQEIRQKRTWLHLLLKDQPQPWYFHQLPPEMLVEICKWVTDPEDQLKLVQLFPSLGPLMHWDEGVLYLKQIFPLIKPYLEQEWRDLWRLCQVCPSFMDVVLTHFNLDLWSEKHWPSPVPVYRVSTEQDVRDLVNSCEQLGRAPWMANMPFLSIISLGLLDHGVQVPDFVTQFLAAYGDKVWGLQIIVNLRDHRAAISHPFLQGILTATPNLVHLKLETTLWRWQMRAPPQPLPHNFPELPQLRYLDSAGPFTLAFAEKYGATLKSLKSWWYPPFPPNARLPQLENYNIHRFEAIETGFPDSILTSPLRSIHFTFNRIPTASHIPKLLEILSHFQNTLEELEVAYSRGMNATDPALLAADKRWMLRVNLPKLRLLNLDKYRGKLDWLILFPSLNTLILRSYSPGTYLEQQRCPDKLQLPTSRNTRYSTNAFGFLRNLKEIRVHDGRQEFVVSREEHAEYNQKIQNGGLWTRISSFFPFNSQ